MVDANYQQQDPRNPVEGAYVQPSPGIVEQVVTLANDAGVSAFGAAGTESLAVITVQGSAAGTAIPVTGVGVGNGVAQASTTAAQLGALVQGATTTAAPTYSDGKTNPLSLTTAGALRADVAALELGQNSTTASQTGPLVQGATTTAAPTYTTDKTNPLSLTTAGALRVDGSAARLAQGADTSGQTAELVMGAVTTAAPTYTTAKSNALSLTTAGRLRVQRACDSAVTAQVGSVASAPSAGAAVATVTPGTAGLWEVRGTVAISGTTVAAADSNNMNLKAASTTVLTNIPIGVQSTTGTSGSFPFGPVVLNLGAADALTVNAVGNSTASSIYAAQIVARFVGG